MFMVYFMCVNYTGVAVHISMLKLIMIGNIVLLLSFISVFVAANASIITSCEGLGKVLKKEGCYRDPGGSKRTLPNHLKNVAKSVDWGDGWHAYLKKAACNCASQAQDAGYKFFGVQHFKECWAGELTSEFFATHSREKKCWGWRPNFAECNDDAETACVGPSYYNYIYEIVQEETEANICEQQLPCKHGECTPNGDSYSCQCDSDYEGDNCETLIDDCAGSPCVNGECIDGVNSYQCKCKDGYEGENCEININDCSGSPCLNGECVDGVNSYQCKCKDGYEGENCEKNIDDCGKNPCRNGGRCVDKVNSYQCVCKTGYNGVDCETNINDCAKKPCRNGGRCVDKVNSYQCVCKAGYNGVNCQTNINECVGNKCVRGKCADGINSYKCTCDYGYEGDKCDKEIMKPSTCVNANWWSSFDKSGWSKCGSTKSFITGFYRSAPKKNEDPIYLLEQAKCCNAIPLLSSQSGVCKEANWVSSLDNNNKWSLCPSGYFMNGLQRSQGIFNRDKLHRIEKGNCCKPKNHPEWYGNCYDEDVGRLFDNQGWSSCSKTGYYMAGVYRGNGADWLHNVAKFRCCQMTSVVTCGDANWVLSFDKKGWSTCGKDNRFITGFYRSKQGAFWKDEIYRLEKARWCSASARYQGEDGRCVDQNWVKTLDKERRWATCPSGYFLNGLERSSGNDIHNIERGKCCRPKNHPAKYGACYDEDIKDEFDGAGWAACGKGGYYVAGVYRNNGDKLHHIQKLRCCKMWE